MAGGGWGCTSQSGSARPHCLRRRHRQQGQADGTGRCGGRGQWRWPAQGQGGCTAHRHVPVAERVPGGCPLGRPTAPRVRLCELPCLPGTWSSVSCSTSLPRTSTMRASPLLAVSSRLVPLCAGATRGGFGGRRRQAPRERGRQRTPPRPPALQRCCAEGGPLVSRRAPPCPPRTGPLKTSATAAVLPHLEPPMPRSPTMPMKPPLGDRIFCSLRGGWPWARLQRWRVGSRRPLQRGSPGTAAWQPTHTSQQATGEARQGKAHRVRIDEGLCHCGLGRVVAVPVLRGGFKGAGGRHTLGGSSAEDGSAPPGSPLPSLDGSRRRGSSSSPAPTFSTYFSRLLASQSAVALPPWPSNTAAYTWGRGAGPVGAGTQRSRPGGGAAAGAACRALPQARPHPPLPLPPPAGNGPRSASWGGRKGGRPRVRAPGVSGRRQAAAAAVGGIGTLAATEYLTVPCWLWAPASLIWTATGLPAATFPVPPRVAARTISDRRGIPCAQHWARKARREAVEAMAKCSPTLAALWRAAVVWERGEASRAMRNSSEQPELENLTLPDMDAVGGRRGQRPRLALADLPRENYSDARSASLSRTQHRLRCCAHSPRTPAPSPAGLQPARGRPAPLWPCRRPA